MLKADIVMKDNTMLNQVMLFKHKDLGDSQILTKSEVIKYLHGNKTVFFGGNYVQGWFIPQQILHYNLYEDADSVETRVKEFVRNNNSVFDTNDTAEYIIEYREQLLELLR